ncbi:hypothetical protein UACE39S_05096 [Ureibacillus acetophenoni]
MIKNAAKLKKRHFYFNTAPRKAENANILRGLNRSAIPREELTNAPITKPIGTEADSQPSALGLRFQIIRNGRKQQPKH